MGKLSYIVSGSGRLAVVAGGQPYTVDPDHPNYKRIKECLKSDDSDQFVKLVDIPKTINSYGQGKVTVANGEILYNGKAVHNSLSKRILWMMNEGFEVSPFLLFLENLMQNPSRRAVNELYTWMEHQDIPITSDGCWIGYKFLQSVTDHRPGEPADKPIYVDVHSKTVRQWLGKVVEMQRNEVDEEWGVACSQGLHVGSSRYKFGGDVKVLVKVNPKDVVSVPSGEIDKCRVCRYEIINIYTEVFNTPVVGPNGENLKEAVSDDYDEEDEDETCEYCGEDDCDGECLDESDVE